MNSSFGMKMNWNKIYEGYGYTAYVSTYKQIKRQVLSACKK